MRGELVLNGRSLAIDGMGHRDRSWHSDAAPGGGIDGYLVRNGVTGDIASADRRVVERRDTRPTQFEIAATDSLGRTIEASGRTNSVLAFNCSPPVFCWFSNVSWQTDVGTAVGEDQECYPFAQIVPLIRRFRSA